ncbi:MAG: pcaK 3 [Holophagaceae bacterium]|nr:pcaK 3 [Holophagaceae bacterium]
MRQVPVSQMIDKAKFNTFFKGVLAICLITTICDGFDINIFGLIIPNLMKDWGLKPQMIGQLGSWGMFGMIFGSLVFGPLADAIGKKLSIIIGTLMYVVFTVSCGFVHSFHAFAICRFIAGFALAGVFPLAVAFTSEYSPKPIRSRLTVWVTSGMAVGTVIAALVGLALINPANPGSWRFMFYISSLMVLLLVAQFSLPESIAYLKKRNKHNEIGKILNKIDPDFQPTADDDYQLEAKGPSKGSLSNLFTNGYAKNTILFWLFMMSSYVFIYGVLMWLPKLMTMKGYSVKGGLFFTMVWNLGFILGIPLFGWMGDKLGGKRTLQIGWVCLAILISIIGFANQYMILTVLLFLTGACQHGVSGAAGAYLAQSYPTSFRATGTTWGYGLGRIGGTAGPLIGGYLLAKGLPVGYNLMFFAIFPLIGAIFASFTTDFFKKPDVALNPHKVS